VQEGAADTTLEKWRKGGHDEADATHPRPPKKREKARRSGAKGGNDRERWNAYVSVPVLIASSV
jgi:hypothetical protein